MRAPLSRRQALGLGFGAAPLLALSSCAPRRAPADTLRIGIDGAPDSLDSLQGQFAAAALLYKQIYTPLTDYGADGKIAPGLAKSWTVSPDGKQWTFTLFEDLHWSDGAALTAEDVAFSVRRALDPDTGYADAGDFYLLEQARNVLEGIVPPSAVGVRAFSATKVVFTLTQPLGVFPELMREFYPQPKHVLQDKQSQWPLPPDFVGSGPYSVAIYTQSRLVLHKNPYARLPASIPIIDIAFIDEAATRARMVRAGDLDLAQDPPANQIADLRARPEVVLYGWAAPKLVYLKINHARSPLNDVRVRHALTLAIDREFLANTVMQSTAAPTARIIANLGANLGASKRVDDQSLAARKDHARALLKQAGFENRLTTTLMHSGGVREGLSVVLAQGWQEIGIDCALTTADPAGLYTFIDEGAFDLAMASFDRGLKNEGWRMIEPFASEGFAANFNWTNTAYDEAVAATRAEADPALRDVLAHTAEDILLDDAAITPLIHEKEFWLAGLRLQKLDPRLPPVQWGRLALRQNLDQNPKP